MMSIGYLPWNQPANTADRVCLRDGAVELTYADFARRVDAVAEQFAASGIGRGDVVAVMLPNRVELLLGLVAAWRLGAAATPINPVFTANEAGYQIRDSQAVLLLTSAVDADYGVPVVLADDLRTEPAGTLPGPAAATDDLALLIYTSGSTGRPKGVMLDHSNLVAMAASIVEAMKIGPADNCLLVLPLFHVNAICVSCLAPMLAGAQVTILDRFAPDTFLDAVAHRVAVRLPRHRGVRPDRGHLRDDGQPGRRRAQAGHRRRGPARAAGGGDGPRRVAAAGRGGRRGGHPGSQRDAWLPQPPGGDRGDPGWRLAAYRGRRFPRRGRVPHPGRPDQGHDHPGWGERVPQGDRVGARRRRRRSRSRRHRRAASGVRRGAGGLRGHLPERLGHAGGSARAVPAQSHQDQAPGRDTRCRAVAEERGRQDRQAGPAEVAERAERIAAAHPRRRTSR